MRRSQVNTILVDAEDFFQKQNVRLPAFAHWSHEEFLANAGKPDYAELFGRQLGWTVADFGMGNFSKDGVVCFKARSTLGQGCAEESGGYEETFYVLRSEQRTPFVSHGNKLKDVVNMGGGNLLVRMYKVHQGGGLDETSNLQVIVDGQERELSPGEVLALQPGESSTIMPGTFHEYYASRADIVLRELSSSASIENSDIYYDPVGIALDIEEDEPPRRLLVLDYQTLLKES